VTFRPLGCRGRPRFASVRPAALIGAKQDQVWPPLLASRPWEWDAVCSCLALTMSGSRGSSGSICSHSWSRRARDAWCSFLICSCRMSHPWCLVLIRSVEHRRRRGVCRQGQQPSVVPGGWCRGPLLAGSRHPPSSERRPEGLEPGEVVVWWLIAPGSGAGGCGSGEGRSLSSRSAWR